MTMTYAMMTTLHHPIPQSMIQHHLLRVTAVTSRSRPQLGSPAGAASVQLRPALYTSAWLGGVSCRIWTLLDIITAQHRF